jgi:hypothetical protein
MSAQIALRPFIEFGEAALLGKHPLVIEARQQLSPIVRDRLRQMLRPLRRVGGALGSAAGAQEGGHIGSRCRGVEADGEVVGLQNGVGGRAGRFEEAAQRPEGGAEASPGGLRLAVRPEEFDKDLAGMHLVAMIGQVGEEGGGLLRGEARDNLVAALGAQASEQSDAPGIRHNQRRQVERERCARGRQGQRRRRVEERIFWDSRYLTMVRRATTTPFSRSISTSC